jgi:hypothetical protein
MHKHTRRLARQRQCCSTYARLAELSNADICRLRESCGIETIPDVSDYKIVSFFALLKLSMATSVVVDNDKLS